MNRTIALLGVLLLVGCENSPPGGPGTANKQPAVGMADNTFKLDGPMTETSIKQGETKTVTIEIQRKNFTQDVAISVSDPPKGVTVTPSSNAIKAADKNVVLTIEASKDAAVGHHVLQMTGTPTTGAKTQIEVKIEVKAAG